MEEPREKQEPTKAELRSAVWVPRLEALRRWMLLIAPFLLIGGYVTDRLPILYATAAPLLVALLATYGIKWMTEGFRKK